MEETCQAVLVLGQKCFWFCLSGWMGLTISISFCRRRVSGDIINILIRHEFGPEIETHKTIIAHPPHMNPCRVNSSDGDDDDDEE